jgi:hypothetical protein
VYTFHEKVKDHHAQSEIVVCLVSVYLAKVAALLQFRRRKVWFSNSASEKASPSSLGNLHRVTIYQSHKRLLRHKKVALVEIADDVAASVNGFHDAGDIRSGPE